MDIYDMEAAAVVGMIAWKDYGIDVSKMPSPWCGERIAKGFADFPGDAAAVAFSLVGAFQRKEYN